MCNFSSGIFLINIDETMRIEGRLHANGESGVGTTGGGGAGGSILVNTHNFDGEGSIEAVGGRGELAHPRWVRELEVLPKCGKTDS